MVEKDFNKISIVCVNSLIPILISFVAQAIALANLDNKVLASNMQLIQTITGPFMYCADELCLMILLAFEEQSRNLCAQLLAEKITTTIKTAGMYQLFQFQFPPQ